MVIDSPSPVASDWELEPFAGPSSWHKACSLFLFCWILSFRPLRYSLLSVSLGDCACSEEVEAGRCFSEWCLDFRFPLLFLLAASCLHIMQVMNMTLFASDWQGLHTECNRHHTLPVPEAIAVVFTVIASTLFTFVRIFALILCIQGHPCPWEVAVCHVFRRQCYVANADARHNEDAGAWRMEIPTETWVGEKKKKYHQVSGALEWTSVSGTLTLRHLSIFFLFSKKFGVTVICSRCSRDTCSRCSFA